MVFTVSTVGEGSSLLVGVRGEGGSFVVGVGRVVGGGGQ